MHYIATWFISCPQVEELNKVTGSAFKSAHLEQNSVVTIFNSRIMEQLDEQRILFTEVQEKNRKELARVSAL